ncbi:putative phosphohydrolase [Bacillus sp. TS-2]|nr:putative phosphohydrolase [Bacillus sp. TS-2]
MKRWLGTLMGIGLVGLGYMAFEAKRNSVLTHELSFQKISKHSNGFTIYFISDVHARCISEEMLQSVGTCDLIIIGGDFTEKGVPLHRTEENIKRLKALCNQIYFVWGNNDLEVNTHLLVKLFNKYGITILDNQVSRIMVKNQFISLVGVNELQYPIDYYSFYKEIKQDDFVLLISHYPNVEDYLPLNHPFSLLLAGHTHGGQIRLGNFGLEERGSLKWRQQFASLVSNGYGTTLVPLRLGAPSETHLIEINKK